MTKRFGRRLEEVSPVEVVPRPPPVAAVAAPDVTLRLRLRAKIMEQLDPSIIAEMSPEILRAELEPVIHQIADQERVQLSALDRRSWRRI